MPKDTIATAVLQPEQDEWKFIEELKQPLYDKIKWNRQSIEPGETSLQDGVAYKLQFPDPEKLLDTAYDDLKTFLNASGIGEGKFQIIIQKIESNETESYRIVVEDQCCRIESGDTEGIRRGIYFLEDELLRSNGPFLRKGIIEHKPLIKTRISRCFFGPINRPPMNRNELEDDINYYPDNYLNRIAHEGINALWLTVSFKELCPSKFFPEHGKGSEKRFEKLRKTVKQCARYGISIYIFCIEPRAFGNVPEYLNSKSDLEQSPCFHGHTNTEADVVFFCTSTPEGQQYLEDCTYHIFSQVPGLGGLIDINLGERPTHCYSGIPNFRKNNCPLCSKRLPWEVFADTTGSMARGIKKAAPEAEMISWLYVPYMYSTCGHTREMDSKVIGKIASHIPENVILQYNFESNGVVEQLGKKRTAHDYWLSYIGPSDIFKQCAQNAVSQGSRVSAKIQVGCSHEVATVPFVPVPGNLYKKYKAMHKLGVSAVMQCWYFGNYPGLMNKAAGELSFAPFPESETDFLLKMAQIYWGDNAETVATAWKYFQEAYADFPVNLNFAWYGPVHNSIVWPLHLVPVDKPISPSWKFTFPLNSGDRIGESIGYDHTLEEILILLQSMAEKWESGLELIKEIEKNYVNHWERKRDISLYSALALQIRSAYNVLKFYDLREKMPSQPQNKQLRMLQKMEDIVYNEINNSLQMTTLCKQDSRLGFHSEAEGYKYFPAKLEWRIKLLNNLLSEEFPAIKQKIESGNALFSEYTGEKPSGKIYYCTKSFDKANWKALANQYTEWRCKYDDENLYFEIKCKTDTDNDKTLNGDHVEVEIEPCRLWPVKTFHLLKNGKSFIDDLKTDPVEEWTAVANQIDKEWIAKFKISFACFDGFYKKNSPLRINITRNKCSWIRKNPLELRLRFGTQNPADLGWLMLEKS